MELLNFFAMVGMTINDLISLYSLTGSFMLFLGSFSSPPKFRKFGDWSILGLGFGGISQIAMVITGSMPERIGVVLPMSAGLVNLIFLASFLLLIGQWQVKKNRWKFI